MRFTLKDYQEEAVVRVAAGLRRSSEAYDASREFGSVLLSAPTGSGKTVIAAAAIENILFGDPNGDGAAEPDAVFVWLTDDPSLNLQTRMKILEASERMGPGDLVVVDDSFDEPKFEGGKVYFLNIQRLAVSSNLVKVAEGRRRFSIWQTISSTIADGGRYYLIRDEAHRGARARTNAQRTIAQKLVTGDAGVLPPSPVVLGISATPERFDEEMSATVPPRVARRVVVPIEQVRESGLIKDVLSIHHKGDARSLEMTLVRDAVRNLRAIDEAWRIYTDKEGEPNVRPAMVIQIPPDGEVDVAPVLDVCVDEWSDLNEASFAHSLQSHTTQEFGGYSVPYVQPQDIQDHPAVRVVIFKEALTTGWDCPRAEVMLSLRRAVDETYIAQLIGRMVRSPLARRVESDDSLNRVLLYLPHFDYDAVMNVKSQLESDSEGPPTEIVLNAVDAVRNPNVPDELFSLFETLPSYVVPGPVHRSQVSRLHRLAALLVGDGLLADAVRLSDDFMVGVIESERSRLDAEGLLSALVTASANQVHSITEVGLYAQEAIGHTTSVSLSSDLRDVDTMFRGAARRFRDGLASSYWGYRVSEHDDDPYDAKVLTIALASDPEVVDRVEQEAEQRVAQWFSTYGDSISRLSEDKKARYSEVRSMARAPEIAHPGLPQAISMLSDAAVGSLTHHLFSDANGNYKARLGEWEQYVVSVESARPDFVGWYRNPTGGQRALRIPFHKSGDEFGKLYPDFMFFHRDGDGGIRPSIVDPHGHHFADAGPKLRGLAAYASEHASDFLRVIGVIRMPTGDYRMLDLADDGVREALQSVATKEDIEEVFSSRGAAY
jgi:type III restriction enzyme